MIPFWKTAKPNKKARVRITGKQNKGCIKPRLENGARHIFFTRNLRRVVYKKVFVLTKQQKN